MSKKSAKGSASDPKAIYEQPAHDSLIKAKLAVMEDVPYVQKTSAQNLNYKFAGEADLIAKLRPEMIRHGIAVSPVSVDELRQDEYSSREGKRMGHLLARWTFRFTHVTSGEFENVQVLGEASDTGDKCAGKAATIALKYALRQFFLIETGDDPDYMASERGAPNEGYFQRAATAIRSKTTNDELDELVASFENDQLPHMLTGAQLEKLNELVLQRRKNIGED